WTENGSATTWNVEYGTAGFTPTGTPTISGTTSNPVTLNPLMDNTTYEVYVQADCGADSSSWVGPFTFSTPCAAITPAYLTDFSTFMPTCWDEATNGALATGPTGLGSGSWSQSGSLARINLYSTGKSDWLVSPEFDLSAGGWQLAIDASANDFSNTSAFSGMGSDDSVQVAISTDYGLTWTEIYSFNASNPPILTNTTYSIDLSAFTGTSNIFGIRATEGTSNDAEDYYFKVSSFEIRVPPTCVDPSAITVSNIQATSADISWTPGSAVQQGWEVSVVDAGMPAMGGTVTVTPSYNATPLTANAAYDVYVREICTPGDTTGWIGPVSFTTPCGTYIPDYLQDFSAYVPECWEEAKGFLTSSTVLTTGSSSWTSDGFANNGYTGAARMNIWTQGQEEWLISPSIDLAGGPFQLEYDVALTTYSGTVATTLDADDSLAVVISTDNGATWSNANILQFYTAGSEPSNTGDHAVIDLSAYSGIVKFGFYATSTDELTVDNSIFIDNFEVTSLCVTSFGTDTQTACESYTWIDGNTYTSSNNTATDTLVNAAGCDSIVTLDLTILTPTAGTDVQTSCGPFTWIDGNTYSVDNNTATFTLTNTAGCDSIVTLDLTVAPLPNTGVTVSGATLTADITLGTGITLSWLDCDGGFAAVPGETGQSFSPTSNGNYALRVDENSCVDTSSCFLIDNVGLDATDFNAVSIVPNPTSNFVNITFEDAQAELMILDINGKLVDQLTIKSGDSVDMTLFENGVYLFKLTSDSISTTERVVKQ
ncbi:MAG: T9SS type A sorting domain-containing protein, partial [Flavobacteriales bacterium]|nr:T9SS type A sorting domain-containing protein [Flavobacteriales bacterium]